MFIYCVCFRCTFCHAIDPLLFAYKSRESCDAQFGVYRVFQQMCLNGNGRLAFSFTEVFGSTGFGNNGFSGIMDILAIPKLKICIKKAQSNGFSGVTDKMAMPNLSVTSENLCTVYVYKHFPLLHILPVNFCVI